MFTPSEQSILALGKHYKEIMNLGFSGKIFLPIDLFSYGIFKSEKMVGKMSISLATFS